MKKYDTPYGKKTAGLLMQAMDAHVREENAYLIIKQLTEKLRQYAPMDANHDGLENCDLIAKADGWIKNRKQKIAETETKINQEYSE
jgi:hypothetical protein